MSGETTSKPAETPANKYPFYTPRFWVGMLLTPWWRLILRHRLRISPRSWGIAFFATLLTPLNSVLHLVQCLLFDRRVSRAAIQQPPLFIIGHWRSGTTFLHELLVLDPRHTFPSTYDCFAPNHFLLTGPILPRLLWFLLPSRRPMDNVAAGWDRPQEDEFALMNMGVPTPYLTMAFPNDEPEGQKYLDLSDLTDAEVQRWKQALLRFLRRINYRDRRRIILKSPPHTGRVKALLELFPDARFIHIVRDPCVLFPSTVRLWKSLYDTQALQAGPYRRLEEHVFESFERMYRAFDQQHKLIPPGHLYEVRYEDLVQDPLGQLRSLYAQLELGDFEAALPHLKPFVESRRDYRTNRYALDEATQGEIARRWGDYARRYGYELSPATAGSQALGPA